MQKFDKVIGWILLVIGLLIMLFSIEGFGVAIKEDPFSFHIFWFAVVSGVCGFFLAKMGHSKVRITTSLTLKQIAFSFRGRISRTTFWLYYIYSIVFTLLVLFDFSFRSSFHIFYYLGVMVYYIVGTHYRYLMIIYYYILYTLISGLFIWVSLAVLAKRCHDRGRSGWFILVGIVPILNLWYLIEMGFLPGTNGENKYGADPLQKTGGIP